MLSTFLFEIIGLLYPSGKDPNLLTLYNPYNNTTLTRKNKFPRP
jgi:hypothetical protein